MTQSRVLTNRIGLKLSTRKKAVPDPAEIPAATPVPDERRPARHRPAKTSMIGRGYEYMDVEPEPTVTASQCDAGPLGFAGSAARGSATEPAGLATLAPDQFGGSSTVPMLPRTWDPQLD